MTMISNGNIHFVHFTSNPGGLEVLLPPVVNNLKNWKFNSFIIRPPQKNGNNVYEDINIKLTYGAYGYYAYWLLLKYARKNKRDIFHVFNIGPYALMMMRLAGARKLIYSIHGTIYWKNKKQKFFRKIIWWFAMSSKYLITSNSEYSKNLFITQVKKGVKPILLYNPIDPDKFARLNLVGYNDEKKIVYSGRLTSGKNLLKWINVAEEIYRNYPDFRFEIYGDGPLKQSLINLISKKKLQKTIILKGFCKQPEKIYQNATLLLFLSEYESFGNVVIESIMCQTPVITSSLPSMKEIFFEYPEFLVELDGDLIQNILIKIEHLQNLKELAVKASVEFRERFSLKQHIQLLENIYASFDS